MRILGLVLVAGLLNGYTMVRADGDPVQVHMSNVDLHVTGNITLHVKQMTGHFMPVGRDVPHLDYKRSYAVAVDAGEIAIDLASLNALMTHSTGGDKSNIDKLRVSINDDGTLGQKGIIDAALNVPFNAKASVSATPDGRIRVRTTSVRSLGVPVNPIMKLFRFEMDDLVKVAPGTGVETDGNDLILDPELVMPPPSVRGHLTAVRIRGNQLVQTFGSGTGEPIASRELSPNHIYWRGGHLSFGKLTMDGTDLEIVDMDLTDPFDFSVDHWDAQLVAGYSKTLPDRGLKAYMPDYNDLSPSRRVVARR
jgi:hypothetical protein